MEELDKDKKDNEEPEKVAEWDKAEADMFKADDSKIAVTVQGTTPAEASGSSAGDVKFGGMPKFTGGRPKFTGGKGPSKQMDKTSFPKLGDAPVEEDSPESGSKGGPPKFSSNNQNMFGNLEVHQTESEVKKVDKQPERRDNYKPRGPRKEKDDFFGNFRNNNKDMGKREEKEEAPAPSSGGPPKFFTNNKSSANTMAKVQEEALKKKQEEDKKREEENKNKPAEKKQFDKGKPKRSEKADNKFERKAPAEKTKAKPKPKPKPMEKADLKAEWKEGEKLEDML